MLSFLWLPVIITPLFLKNNQTTTVFIRDDDEELENREVKYWIGPAIRYWFRMVSTCLEMTGLTLYGRDVAGGVPRSREISNGRMEQAPESVLDIEKRLKILAIRRQGRRQLLVSIGGREDQRLLQI